MKHHLALLPLFLFACARAPSPAEPEIAAAQATARTQLEPKASESPATVQAPTDPSAPASAGPIAELLGARHAEDLPTRQTLDAHPEPDQALAWLADKGDSAAIRVRAIRSLGLYPERDHRVLLAKYAGPSAPHPTLRAAAFDALAAYSQSERQPHLALIAAGTQDTDPRVARSAERAAEGLSLPQP